MYIEISVALRSLEAYVVCSATDIRWYVTVTEISCKGFIVCDFTRYSTETSTEAGNFDQEN